MGSKWEFRSETYDNCNCAVNCGCQFNLPSTHGYCESAYAGHLVDGHFNDVSIKGLNWAALYKWPGEIKEGNGMLQVVVDERGDDLQRDAIFTIVSGGACEPFSNAFSVFAEMCSDIRPPRFLPIHLEADLKARTAQVEIPGLMTSVGKPLVDEFSGEPFHIALARRKGSFEFTYAEVGTGTTTVSGDLNMSFEESWAHFCVHHFNQDGIVRKNNWLSAWLGY